MFPLFRSPLYVDVFIFADVPFVGLHCMLMFCICRCTFCSSPVDEDESAGPKSDSRLLLAKFNAQMEKLYDLLQAVENIR